MTFTASDGIMLKKKLRKKCRRITEIYTGKVIRQYQTAQVRQKNKVQERYDGGFTA